MRRKTLTLLVAFVLAPVFALACGGGGDTESADADDATPEESTMEAAGDAMEGGDPGEGEEGHAHDEGEEGDAAGEEGEAGHEGDEMADTMAAPDTSGTH